METINPSIRVGGTTTSVTDYASSIGGVTSTNLTLPMRAYFSADFVSTLTPSATLGNIGSIGFGYSNSNGATGTNSRWAMNSSTFYTGSMPGNGQVMIPMSRINELSTYEPTSSTNFTGTIGATAVAGNASFTYIAGNLTPISQGDVTGVSVGANMTVTVFQGTTTKGYTLYVRNLGSCTPMSGAITVTAANGATLTVPSGAMSVRLYVSLDTSGTALVHSSWESMAKSAADSGESFGVTLIGSGSNINPRFQEMFHENLWLPSATSLYLHTPVGTADVHCHYRFDVVR